jgi:hypothetical protein
MPKKQRNIRIYYEKETDTWFALHDDYEEERWINLNVKTLLTNADWEETNYALELAEDYFQCDRSEFKVYTITPFDISGFRSRLR